MHVARFPRLLQTQATCCNLFDSCKAQANYNDVLKVWLRYGKDGETGDGAVTVVIIRVFVNDRTINAQAHTRTHTRICRRGKDYWRAMAEICFKTTLFSIHNSHKRSTFDTP